MLQPCDKAATGLTDGHATPMVATHAGTSSGALNLTHRDPHGVTLSMARPINVDC